MDSVLYLCGKFISSNKDGVTWEFQGIFDDKKKAIEACIKLEYFIAPVKLNEKICDEKKEFPNCEYPLFLKEEYNG